jgi:NAD(P)-dependent dehydrogenase (short-subunit alcohol dehydrogenase family)
MTERKPTWLITGVSSGFGRALAEAVVARGETVIGTLRRPDQLAAFESLAPGRTLACRLDLTDHARVTAMVHQAIARAGGVDVVVNNAGYGLVGAVEEVSDAEARHQMETNFFGALAVTQAALPYMRRQRHGHIVNISSLAGIVGTQGMAMYSASKFALEGFSEALAAEVKPLGIKVTIVEPGGFRTSWASAHALARAARVIDEYAPTAGVMRANLDRFDGHQPGDPAKAAAAIIAAVDAPNPPLRLALGPDAVQRIRAKLDTMSRELAMWEAVSKDTQLGVATAVSPSSSR